MGPHPLFFRMVVVVAALLCVPSSTAAPTFVESGDSAQVVGCEQGTRRVGPDTFVQSFDGTMDVTNGIAGSPPRATLEVEPGRRTSTCVGFINRSGQTVRLHLDAVDVAAGRPGEAAIQLEPDSPFGVSDWLTVPDTDDVTIDHGQALWVVMHADVPADATAGSYYSAIEGSVILGETTGTALTASVGVQVFFTIPGDAAASGKIVDARAPRVVWWDGLELGRLPILERLRGRESATFRFSWRNTGDFTDEVHGRVLVESDLGDRDVARIEVDEQVVLRQSERQFTARWANDIPIMGRFTPTIEMQGVDGRSDTVELDPIWVIPSWTYLLALALAIGIPTWWRRRARRRYDELLARVEAAEARGGTGADDDDWDDHSDGWR